MSLYIFKVGGTLAEALEHAAAVQPGQFAGYWANIDFWISEYEHLFTMTTGYEKRLAVMIAAHDEYVAARGGPHNIDDLGEPFQTVTATSKGDRMRVIGRARRALTRLVERAIELELVDGAGYDKILERIASFTR